MYQASELELNKFLSAVLQHDGSDLHLITGELPAIRADGKLFKLDNFDVLSLETMSGIVSVLLNKKQREMFDNQQDIDVSYQFNEYRFRINVYRQKGVLGAAFRLIPSNVKTIKELNLPEKLLDFANVKEGLMLMVGPTGHGKSTALASLVDYINHNRSDHILTIEDPIEFMFAPDKSLINQREVYIDTPSFQHALRASLREDVDVVLVGEMRDLESISSVITLAETGHLVFATLHTNDAAQSVDRIVDVFPPHQQVQIKMQLANVLLGIVSMRLLQKIGGGRVPAVEILMANSAVRNMIREGKSYEIDNVIQTSMEEGMITLDRSLALLVTQNIVSLEEAQPYAKDSDYFLSLLTKQLI